MASNKPPSRTETRSSQNGKKRKDPPTTIRAAGSSNQDASNKKARHENTRYQGMREARQISAQTSSKALKNGALDVEKFVRAREYEIHALEKGLRDSKKILTKRAFQQVPKDLRRRTASHNAKRVPKRLQGRAKREMADDHTPPSKRKKPTRHTRLRLETVKRLRALGARRRAEKEAAKEEKRHEYGKITVHEDSTKQKLQPTAPADEAALAFSTRKPKLKSATLAKPQAVRAKYRKRQRHKAWLPTHLFHAKRARMTDPSTPLWRFAIPMTPTAKGYRPTHRAANERGAVAWDVSYISTIGLEGRKDSLISMLWQVGVEAEMLEGRKGQLWREGKRAWEGWFYERERPHTAVAPSTIIWQASSAEQLSGVGEAQKRRQQLLIRVHPSAFMDTWQELLRLSTTVKPEVKLEDLRFEIGSIDVVGPGSTEALLGALWPCAESPLERSPEHTFVKLSGLANPSMLPRGALLGFDAQDPRLHYPPRTIAQSETAQAQTDAQQALLELVASWPPDEVTSPANIFDRSARLSAQSALPSQKAINRRRALALPGEFPARALKDPRIPLLLYTSPSRSNGSRLSAQVQWTVLLPWKCVNPIWYSVMYCPLSTGGQPRFGGLLEQQQLTFELGLPWFPGDSPGTGAGWAWEVGERSRRWHAWARKPKGKRVQWEKVDLGAGNVGEVGDGWSCDWSRLLDGPPEAEAQVTERRHANGTLQQKAQHLDKATTSVKTTLEFPLEPPAKPSSLHHIPARLATSLLASAPQMPSKNLAGGLVTVQLAFLTRGVPEPCARIYRLPAVSNSPHLRERWLTLHPAIQSSHSGKSAQRKILPQSMRHNEPAHMAQRRLAQTLLQPSRAGEDNYPSCPHEEDLIGFVTSGSFNLGEGLGTGVGSLLLERVLEMQGRRNDDGVGGGRVDEGRLCIVRNAGQSVGRLARWTVA